MLSTRLFTISNNMADTKTCAVNADVKMACVKMVDSCVLYNLSSDVVILSGV